MTNAAPTLGLAGRDDGPSPLLLATAFATVYLVWGSTFLAIRVIVETVPPISFVGVRSLVAGVLLLGLARLSGAALPDRAGWLQGLVTGGLMFMVGQGALAWAEQRVASGLAAVMLATTPLWVALIGWTLGGGRPTGRVAAGLGLGFAGVVLLTGVDGMGGGLDVAGVAVLQLGAAAWALGTILTKRRAPASSPAMTGAVQLLGGGVLALPAGGLMGEWPGLPMLLHDGDALAAFAYLVVFGTLVGFGAFSWLVKNCPAERVATYAYVNPVVAIALGWMVLDETIGPREGIAAAVVLAGVAVVLTGKKP